MLYVHLLGGIVAKTALRKGVPCPPFGQEAFKATFEQRNILPDSISASVCSVVVSAGASMCASVQMVSSSLRLLPTSSFMRLLLRLWSRANSRSV